MKHAAVCGVLPATRRHPMRTLTVWAGLSCALALSAGASAQEKTVRLGGVEVAADSPLARNEHPRLLLTRAQLPAMRARLKAPEIASLLEFAKKKAAAGQADPVLLGVLYQLTGEKTYADQAKAKLGRSGGALAYCLALDLVADTMTEAELSEMAARNIAYIKANQWQGHLLLELMSVGHGHDDELLPLLGECYQAEVVRTTASHNQWSRGRGGSSMSHGYNGEHFYSTAFADCIAWSNASGIDWVGKADYATQTPAWYLYHYRPWGLSLVRIGVISNCGHLEALMPKKSDGESLVVLSTARDRNGLAQWWVRDFIGKLTWDYYEPQLMKEGTGGLALWGRLLWEDPSIPSIPLSRFPETRLFPENGHVVMRSDWTPQATMALFRCGRFGEIDGYWGRNNADNLHFIILKQGILTESSGPKHALNMGAARMTSVRDPDAEEAAIGSYGRQTIAANSITVGREDLPIHLRDGRVFGVVKAGGQSPVQEDGWYEKWGMPRQALDQKFKEGDIVAYETSPVFDYAAGDATHSYSPARVKSIVRQFVYLKPDLFVVYDRVTPASPDLETVWHLHTLSKPVWNGVTAPDPAWTPEKQFILTGVDKTAPNPHPGGHFLHTAGDTFVADDGVMEGRLFVKAMPTGAETPVVRTVGGPWHDFEVNGVNYGPTEATYKRTYDDRVNAMGVGGWRIELVGDAKAAQKQFLAVLQAATRKTEKMADVRPVQDADRTGVEITSGTRTFRVLFNTRGKTGGHIVVTEQGKTLVDRDLAQAIEDNYSKWSDDPRYKEWMTNPYMRTVIGPAEQDAWKAAHPQ